ncbi:hypothetical protein ACQCT5_17045 [Sutcliffiella halmapala]
MGVIYIERSLCSQNVTGSRRCSCSSCNPGTDTFPNPSPTSPIRQLAERLRIAENRISENTARIVELEAEVDQINGETGEVQQFFEANMNEEVAVSTSFGVVSGMVETVGVDVAVVVEENGDIVLVPFTSVTTV